MGWRRWQVRGLVPFVLAGRQALQGALQFVQFALQRQAVALQQLALPGGGTCLQVGTQRDGVSAGGLGFQAALHSRPGPGAVHQAGLKVLDVQLPCPALWSLLAFALQLACGHAGLGLLHLPQALRMAGF